LTDRFARPQYPATQDQIWIGIDLGRPSRGRWLIEQLSIGNATGTSVGQQQMLKIRVALSG